ncbi:MAG: N-6 DNA methylase [Veillonella sp.]
MKDGVLLRQVINVIDDDVDFSDYDESHAFGDIYETHSKELVQSAGSENWLNFIHRVPLTDFMAAMINPQVGEVMADFAAVWHWWILLISWLNELHKKVETVADEEAYSSSIYGIEKKQFPYMLAITNLLLRLM